MHLTRREHGFTLLEVLITMIVLAIGLLGLASLQSKVQVAQVETYQRAQGVLLLEDMLARMNANRGNVASYITGTTAPLGHGDSQPATCATAAGALQDLCEWSNALKGAAEKSGGNSTGAMINARGCVEQIQAPNPANGFCVPGVYRVTVAWQGLTKTSIPAVGCGEDLYGDDDAYRRVVTGRITIGLNGCL